MNGFSGVIVADFLKQMADGNLDPKFFVNFTDQTLFKGFSGFTLASGKFPQPAQMGIRAPLGDQQFAAAENECGADLDGFQAILRRIMNRLIAG